MSNLSRLLKESWTLVEEDQDRVAGYFYAKMFLSNPQLRDLFPVQMDVQRARLLGAIVTAVQSLEDPERFDEYLRSLGRDHRKFHVTAEHYDVVGAALLEALRAFGGEHWSVEYDQAWSDAYQVIAKKMIAGAEADANPPFWHAEVPDDAGPQVHPRRGLCRRGYRPGADQGAGRGAHPLQPHPVGTPVLRRQAPRRPVRPGRAQRAGGPVPVAVAGLGGQRRSRLRRRAGQHRRHRRQVRSLAGARLLRLRLARDGQVDPAPPRRTPDPV